VTLPNSGGTVNFKYDPFGRRIYKSSSSATSVYVYDRVNLIEETSASGAAVARYAQGLNIDAPLAMLRSSTTSYYQVDGLGSVTSVSSTARHTTRSEGKLLPPAPSPTRSSTPLASSTPKPISFSTVLGIMIRGWGGSSTKIRQCFPRETISIDTFPTVLYR
jgi:hypothetical protein